MNAVTYKKERGKGFTLLEILVVIGIMGLLLSFTANPLLSFYRQIVFQGAVENVLTMLDEARKSTLSSYYSTEYGVHFETGRVVLFRGNTFNNGDSNNDEYILDVSTNISNITLNGGVIDVVFDRITGETSTYGSIVVEQISGNLSSSTITIHSSGLVEVD